LEKEGTAGRGNRTLVSGESKEGERKGGERDEQVGELKKSMKTKMAGTSSEQLEHQLRSYSLLSRLVQLPLDEDRCTISGWREEEAAGGSRTRRGRTEELVD